MRLVGAQAFVKVEQQAFCYTGRLTENLHGCDNFKLARDMPLPFTNVPLHHLKFGFA